MSVQYAGGTNVNTTFTCTVGTRREIVDGLVAALTTAGWSTISGAGTGTVVMRSASTPTAGNSIDIRVTDPGSGNCAQVRIQDAAATLIGQALWLLPAAGKVYRVIANKHQFFVFNTSGTVAAREYVMVSVPYIPSFLHGVIVGDFGVSNSNSDSDTNTSVRLSLRTAGYMGNNGNVNWSAIMNGVIANRTAFGASAEMRLVVPGSAWTDDYGAGYQWHDGSFLLSEPLLAFSLPTGEAAKIRGQLWDSVWCSEAFAGDLSAFSFDSHAWYSVTAVNVGSGSGVRGTLLVVIP